MNVQSFSNGSFEGLIYVGGILLWCLIWRVVNGYTLMRQKKMIYIPFLYCFATLGANAWISFFYNKAIGTTALEESLFSFLDMRTQNIVQATAGVLIIATVIYQTTKRHLPQDFLRFIALAYVFLIGIMSPVIWIPVNKPDWLKKLLAYQTVAFIYGIFLSIGGIIVLIDDLYRASLEDPEKVREEKEKKEIEKEPY